jgi:MFS family permease
MKSEPRSLDLRVDLGLHLLFGDKATALLASSVGAAFEWFEFSCFGAWSDIIGAHFFPRQSPTFALRMAFALFFVGFISRPVGAVAFGYIGDRYGRVPVLVWSAVLMVVPTVGMTMIPSYDSIGIVAPSLLVLCRVAQGLSLGGEAGGGITFALESVEPWHRGKMGALFQASGSLGSLVANLASGLIRQSLKPEDLRAWGWKVPFFAGVMGLALGAWLRSRLRETGPVGVEQPASARGAAMARTVRESGSSDAPIIRPGRESLSSSSGDEVDGACARDGPEAESGCAKAYRVCWLIGALSLWMTFGFWAYVFIPAYLTSVRQPPMRAAYTIAAVAQLGNVLSLLVFAAASDRVRRGKRRRSFLFGGAALCAFVFPLASLVLDRIDGTLGCYLVMLLASIAHAVHGGSVTPYLFEHAGSAHTRLSTITLTWALGSTLFAGTMPTICEALSASTGSIVAPGLWISLIACVSATAVLFGEPARDRRRPDEQREDELYLELVTTESSDGKLAACGVI